MVDGPVSKLSRIFLLAMIVSYLPETSRSAKLITPTFTVAAAQQHLKKGALRELHWHKVVSNGFSISLHHTYVYIGRMGLCL